MHDTEVVQQRCLGTGREAWFVRNSVRPTTVVVLGYDYAALSQDRQPVRQQFVRKAVAAFSLR